LFGCDEISPNRRKRLVHIAWLDGRKGFTSSEYMGSVAWVGEWLEGIDSMGSIFVNREKAIG